MVLPDVSSLMLCYLAKKDWKLAKEEGERLFNPGKGGSYEVIKSLLRRRCAISALLTRCLLRQTYNPLEREGGRRDKNSGVIISDAKLSAAW